MAVRTPACMNVVSRVNVVLVSIDEHLFDCAN
jgi:hypothetical protein